MSTGLRLEGKLSRSLVLTPRMSESIQILQLSQGQLQDLLAQLVLENPFLALDPAQPASDSPQAPDPPEELPPAPPPSHGDSPESSLEAPRRHTDTDLAAYNPAEQMRQPKSLRNFLLEQIGQEFRSQRQQAIARVLLDELDEVGWFTTPLARLAERVSIPPDELETVLRRLQGLEPAGIFATSLAHCLSLQLERLDQLSPPMRTLLKHLDLLAAGNRNRLEHLCGLNSDGMDQLVARLRRLDPKPGVWEETPPTLFLTADVVMRPDGNGDWTVETSAHQDRPLRIDREYYRKIRAHACQADQTYLRSAWVNANWYGRAIRQRNETILKVAREIVRFQSDFFRQGISGLRPLALRDIADATGFHESTISRSTANKYIQTPRGLFELKFFFPAPATRDQTGTSSSAESVRHRIRQLITHEPRHQPYSDDRIVSLLRSEGIVIARRTVSKHRESMKIASSSLRRRTKAF